MVKLCSFIILQLVCDRIISSVLTQPVQLIVCQWGFLTLQTIGCMAVLNLRNIYLSHSLRM